VEITLVLSKDALEKLLVHLDEDRELAGKKYETLRLGLIRFFEWRGCAFSSDHADETIDRVARRIVQGEEIRNIHNYTAGVARFVFMEIVKEREKQQMALRQLPPDPVREENPEDDTRAECLRRCLQALPPESLQLMMDYYRSEGRNKIDLRKKLAQQRDISAHTLRMRLQRLRGKLEECIADCLNSRSESDQ